MTSPAVVTRVLSPAFSRSRSGFAARVSAHHIIQSVCDSGLSVVVQVPERYFVIGGPALVPSFVTFNVDLVSSFLFPHLGIRSAKDSSIDSNRVPARSSLSTYSSKPVLVSLSHRAGAVLAISESSSREHISSIDLEVLFDTVVPVFLDPLGRSVAVYS